MLLPFNRMLTAQLKKINEIYMHNQQMKKENIYSMYIYIKTKACNFALHVHTLFAI